MPDLLSQFGTAYLINLVERTDKLASAKRELTRVGWKLGPGGVTLYAAHRFSERAGFPNAAIRGCFHSHHECLRLAHEAGRKSVVVLEDDIALSPAIPKLSPAFLAKLAKMRWDILYLGHELTGDIPNASPNTTDVVFVPLPPGKDILTAHCYAVHERILPRLLAHLDRVASGVEGDQEFGPMPVDGAYNIFRRNNPDIVALLANPKIGWQRSFRSDITPRQFDNIRLLRPVTNVLRHLKYAVTRWRS